jgi:hypothetical protein
LVGSLQNADIVTKIETSIDYINWIELDYVETTSGNTKIYKKLKTELGLYYFDISSGALYSESEIDTANLAYTFKKYNEYSKEYSYVYDNLEWKFLRISFSNIAGTTLNPLFFTHLNIHIEEDFDDNSIDKSLLEFKSSMFVKSKMYEEFEFFPDIIRNYLVMLEEKNHMHDSRNFINVNVCHDFVSPYPDPEGIGNDIVGYDTVVYT